MPTSPNFWSTPGSESSRKWGKQLKLPQTEVEGSDKLMLSVKLDRRKWTSGKSKKASHLIFYFSTATPNETAKDQPNLFSHWKSTYNGVVEERLSKDRQRSERPLWSLPRQAYSSKRSYFHTEYMKSLGTYGHNPRDKLNHGHEKMENENHELT